MALFYTFATLLEDSWILGGVLVKVYQLHTDISKKLKNILTGFSDYYGHFL